MGDAAFPIGMLIVFAGGACFMGINTTNQPEKIRAYGLGMLGAFIAFGALLVSVGVSS